jgi:endonuclease/exonuclease/phosphatase family metal-dependent hydrolase
VGRLARRPVSPLSQEAARTRAAGGDLDLVPVRIISLNTWGGAMFDELAAWLGTCDADILCLQEVTHTPGLGGWTRFDDADRSLPQRANLLADVRSLLPHHHGLFTASDAGPVQDHRQRQHQQDFGLATFVTETLPLVGLRSAFVHGDYTEHRGRWPNGGRPRAALAVRVHDRRAQRFVTVVNLHGLRDPRGKADTPARHAQAQRLAALIEEARRGDDLTVVKLEAPKARRICMSMGLMTLPSFVMFHEGEEVSRLSDPDLTPARLDAWLEETLASAKG